MYTYFDKCFGGYIMRKHHKHVKKIIKIFLLLLIPLILLALTTNSTEQTIKADREEVVVIPKNKPNDPPKKFLGIWMTNGYGLQPAKDSYTSVGIPITIRAKAGRSMWSVLFGAWDSPHFRWSKSTDGKNWTDVSSNDNGHNRNFTITPNEVGTTWYQLDTQYYATSLLKTHIYSEVAAVHTLADPIVAEKLNVTVDDDYLYNTSDNFSNTTYAHAVPVPEYATGEVTNWTVDKPELATIDEDGEITANSNGLSGWVEATATWKNTYGGEIYGSTSVEVGNGIDDQTVKSGQTATFSLRGNTGGSGEDEDSGTLTIEWFKNGKSVASGKEMSEYTTPKTTMADDGAMYHAVLTFKKGIFGSAKKTTNKARLTVLPLDDPDIQLTNKIVNNSFVHENNTDNHLINVVNGDSVTYSDNLFNQSTEGPLNNAYYVIPLYKQTQVNSVTVDGTILAKDDYTIGPNSDTGNDDLIIKLGDIAPQSSKNISVDTTVKNITGPTNLKFTPYIYGDNKAETSVYRKNGTPEIIDYISDLIYPNVQNIDFGSITPYSKNKLLYRPKKINNPNNIINIDDQRRDKDSVSVYVAQYNDFINENGDTLPANLRYYEDGNYKPIYNNKIKIHESDTGSNLSSIAWNKEDGLLLHIDDNLMTTGKYTTTLTWSFENTL